MSQHRLGGGAMAELFSFRSRLLRKYGLALIVAITGTLLVSGVIGLFFSYRDQSAVIFRLEHEQAAGAAATIQRFVQDIVRQIEWSIPPAGLPSTLAASQRREAYYRLLHQNPAVTD